MLRPRDNSDISELTQLVARNAFPVVLAWLLPKINLRLSPGQKKRPFMEATLEPRTGVKMIVKRRRRKD